MSLSGIKPTNTRENARRKYKRAVLKYLNPNMGGTNSQVRQVLAEWNAWERASARRPSSSRPSASRPSASRPSASRRMRVLKPHFTVFGQVFKFEHKANLLRFTMDRTVGSVLDDLRAYASVKCPEMFRGFSILLVCLDDNRNGNKVARKVHIDDTTDKRTKLSTLMPNSEMCTDVLMNVIVPPTPPTKNRSKFIFF